MATDEAAKVRYLASANHGPVSDRVVDLRVYAPEPAAIFFACGKQWELRHARNIPGLKRFMEIVREGERIEKDQSISEVERDWQLLKLLVPDLLEEAFSEQHLSRNQLAELVRLGYEGDGRPPMAEGEAAPASTTSSASTAATTPETPPAS